MPVLTLNDPLVTAEPVLLVENRLEVGSHVFRLVVVDDDKLESAPMDITVRVQQPTVVLPPIVIVQPPIAVSPPPPPVIGPIIGPIIGPVITPLPPPPPVIGPIVNPIIRRPPG